jgi:hypothetical protein
MYAQSELLREVHRIACGTPKGLGVDAEYPSVLGFTALSVAAWARASGATAERAASYDAGGGRMVMAPRPRRAPS